MLNLFNTNIDIPDFNNGYLGSNTLIISLPKIKFIFIRHLNKIIFFEVKTLRFSEFISIQVGLSRLQDKDLIGLGKKASEQIARSGKSIRVG